MDKWQEERFFSEFFGFHLSYHSTAAPYSFPCRLGDGRGPVSDHSSIET